MVRKKLLVLAEFVGMYCSGVGIAGSVKRKMEVDYDIVITGLKRRRR